MNPAQQLKTSTPGPLGTLNNYFTKHKGQLAAALPKHLNPDRMIRLALTAFSQNKAIAECTPESIFASVIMASQLGLEVGVMGQGYFVPYKKTCTFIPGWQGYVDLVSRSGRGSVWSGAVFEGDEFDWMLGTQTYVRHKPKGENDPNKLSHVYAIGRVNGAQDPIIEVWPIAKVWAHRDRFNKVGRNHYSFQHPEMYARKIPLLQVIKYMPKSVEMAKASEIDIAASEGKGYEFIDGDFVIVENDEPARGEEPKVSDLTAKGKAESVQPHDQSVDDFIKEYESAPSE